LNSTNDHSLITARLKRQRNRLLLSSALILFLSLIATNTQASSPPVITTLKNISYRYDLSEFIEAKGLDADDTIKVFLDGMEVSSLPLEEIKENRVTIKTTESGYHELRIEARGNRLDLKVHTINGFLSLLPPLIAIIFALVFRQVVVALLSGVWVGLFILTGYSPVESLLRIVDDYVINTLSGPQEGANHISIIVFTLLLGGMVGISSRMGGMQGIVDRVSAIATTPRRGQFAAWLMGVIIFFDDYTNTLIVGNSIRPLSDKLKISREKLSYIVDSTAAPVTALAVITSWIGFEISILDQTFNSLGLDRNPLTTFVASIPYSFYPILAIVFVLLIALSGRDYSLMLSAERRARSTGKVIDDNAMPLSNLDSEAIAAAANAKPRWFNGVIPIAVVIVVTFVGLIYTGREALLEKGIRNQGFIAILKESDSFKALLWSSFSGCITAALLAVTQRLLSITETVSAWVNGIKSMFSAIIILVLAWLIGRVCTEVHTADFLVQSLSSAISVRFIPLFVFLISMGISFATGTSWGTLSILIPIVIPLVVGASRAAQLSEAAMNAVLLPSIAAILSGAVFGDHCSPISDTTIMSSMASGSDHIDHVRTQLPYSLTVGLVAIVFGYIPTAFGLHPAVSIILSIAVLTSILFTVGRPTDSLTDQR